MTRCIHCTRCVRFSEEVAGYKFLGTLNRGYNTEIGTYVTNFFTSNVSGNVIDLCPVGALTSRLYAFKARPWELRTLESIDLTDSVGSHIFVAVKQTNIVRITPKKNVYSNTFFISDKARFSFDAVTNLRLLESFWKTTSWHQLNLQFLFSHLRVELTKKRNLFLIPEDLDYQNLLKLASLERGSAGKIIVRSVNSWNLNTKNFYSNLLQSTISNFEKNFKLCYILSSNLKLENVLLNLKIRTKFLKARISVFSAGFSFSATFPNYFVTLNLNSLLQLFESKIMLSLSFLLEIKTWFILGTSLNTRVNTSDIIASFKNFFPKSNFLTLKKAANSESLNFLNTKMINTNLLHKGQNLYAWCLENNLVIHKLLVRFSKAKYWINSHSPTLAQKSTFLIPTLTSFENEGIFFNFEGHSKKACKSIINLNKNLIHFEFFFSFFSTFYKNRRFSLLSPFSYFLEMCNKSILYDSTTNLFNQHLILNSLNFFLKYPLKSSIEDFYQTNAFTKNSLNMYKRSKEIRKVATNFFKQS